MVVLQEKLVLLFLYSLVLGFVLGFVYDYFRIRRLCFSYAKTDVNTADNKKKYRQLTENVIVFFEDVLFGFICSVFVCIFLYYVNSGRFRSLAFVGMIIGFIVYRKTLGKLVIFCSGYVISFIKRLIKTLLLYTLIPIFRLIVFLFKNTVGKLIYRILTEVRCVLTLMCAERGFGITKIKGKNQ